MKFDMSVNQYDRNSSEPPTPSSTSVAPPAGAWIETTIALRIRELIAAENLSERQFAARIGLPQPTLNNIVRRGTDVKCAVLCAIIRAFPHVSARWLLTGQGTMTDDEPTVDVVGRDGARLGCLDTRSLAERFAVMVDGETMKLVEKAGGR